MRLNKLKNKLDALGLKAFVFTNRDNIFYFSGYTGEGMLAINGDKQYIVTDFRYIEQVRRESPESEIAETGSRTHFELLGEIFSGAKKTGFEEDDMTVSQLKALKKSCKGTKLVPTRAIGLTIRSVKEREEIGLLKNAANATQDALHKAYETAAFGMKEIELCADLEYFLKQNYGAAPAFDFIVASGDNGSMPHAVTGERKFSAGDMVTLDFGAKINMYNSDMTRTFAMGSPSTRMHDIYKIVQEAQNKAQESLAPGKACKDIDKIARDIIKKYGYGEFFGHGTGHGVGINIHEEPRLNAHSETILKEGMVVTVEPGIYIPGLGGVRIENTCYITEEGYESFFDASTDLNIIDGGKI